MLSSDLPPEYDIAEGPTGPEGLGALLVQILEQVKENPSLAKRDHYILYKFASQQSLIQVDTTQVPFHFQYSDLLGRPATAAVKDAVAKFLWESGERERYTKLADERGDVT